MERREAETLLRTAIGDSAGCFRDGQWEAIDALVNHRQQLMVVQRTGWGKSSVYFISTRILRDSGAGPTVIVSPLLALMRNQIEAAQRLGIRAETINSTNQQEWPKVQRKILSDQVDAILISPERLSNESFVEEVLLPIADRIGLLVVDEAHCISDWGHDFRPDYRRLVNILQQLPPNVPLLGTTATANNRVIKDVQSQLGDIEIQRGTLVRESLVLQTLRMKDQASRLAWLAQRIPELPGTGIVYVLTVRDAEQVAEWLQSQGIEARAYYGSVEHPDFADKHKYREHLEDLLLHNKIKALVATTALGMGYDKPDLGFVIHYQTPGSIIGYYQQVGRAGRGIDTAYGVLLSGKEDEDIHEFFRRSAFPDERDVNAILDVLAASDGLSLPQIQSRLNLRQGQIEKVLKVLSVETPAPLIKEGSRWLRTPVQYTMDHERIQRLTEQREGEWKQIIDYVDSQTCLMAFLRNALDNPEATECGRCSACRGEPVVGIDVDRGLAVKAGQFLRHAEMTFSPKKQVDRGAFATYNFLYGPGGRVPQSLCAENGRILSRWGDAGWGGLVTDDKHTGHFRDELVGAVADMIDQRWQPDPAPRWVTCVPSRNHPNLVPDFARRLAARLNLPFVDAIDKVRDNEQQKMQQNRFHQCRNLDGVFQVAAQIPSGPLLLVDDMIDSGWTVTVLAALLRRAGSGPVFPVALASTTSGD
ncbi:RecQ family ATP-dependent DNA helicase [Thiorhodovibrio frisius]|uniref:DNA 3'-5' helicase n=1 Tax=Thiorhodovibrio frisius TaxID=631362 RepID=H8Z2G8_9GAMM|nr:RecQ family ATP-dependent DNA helicase [Thiorhodovibrio frisius]EIC21623.1 ATP-dependent DNA helicase, RecQ family [Thiorhodovibrio frisius]WPL21589.1 ATP-dependent DNA helicase RecQ [Thiorhodovibrio frisius]